MFYSVDRQHDVMSLAPPLRGCCSGPPACSSRPNGPAKPTADGTTEPLAARIRVSRPAWAFVPVELLPGLEDGLKSNPKHPMRFPLGPAPHGRPGQTLFFVHLLGRVPPCRVVRLTRRDGLVYAEKVCGVSSSAPGYPFCSDLCRKPSGSPPRGPGGHKRHWQGMGESEATL